MKLSPSLIIQPFFPLKNRRPQKSWRVKVSVDGGTGNPAGWQQKGKVSADDRKNFTLDNLDPHTNSVEQNQTYAVCQELGMLGVLKKKM